MFDISTMRCVLAAVVAAVVVVLVGRSKTGRTTNVHFHFALTDAVKLICCEWLSTEDITIKD